MTSKYTRVNPYFSEMVIKPHSFIDELGFDYEFTYYDNPQLRLSSTVVNWVTTAGEFSVSVAEPSFECFVDSIQCMHWGISRMY